MTVAEKAAIAAFVVGLLWCSALALRLQAQAKPRVWQSDCHSTLNDMVRAMNRLQATDVHVVTIPSSRNIGGVFGNPYCLVWR